MDEKKHLWDRFIRLGEMMGDGLHHESDGKWISRDYKKLSKILVPEINEQYKEQRKLRNQNTNEKIAKLIESKSCSCGGKLKQSRSGSLICYCENCNARYKAQKVKK